MKTHQDWPPTKSLGQYLSVGDIVDQEMVNHFLNVVPPACEKEDLVQLGEASYFVEGKSVFPTVVRDGGQWIYAGNCHQFKSKQP